ncbi:beta-lactamase class A [Haloferula luteola]|uniref:beta-lactamase n=1 Tax=Haloferula luteola TaxID=595692 RepID=A0A840VA49_9BACT|nr:class A beta-lactamase [Haloferula luteola]MBB5351558.1 beta-lactamase class A [Haloferula luteola]
MSQETDWRKKTWEFFPAHDGDGKVIFFLEDAPVALLVSTMKVLTIMGLGSIGLAAAAEEGWSEKMEALEARHGGRLGVAALQVKGGKEVAYRGDEAFAMCSTFKLLLAATIASEVEKGTLRWDQEIAYGKSDLLDWAPVTGKEEALEAGRLSVAALAEAAVTWSDNPAANLLLASCGGPEGLTAWLRGTGDEVTRLDRNEPTLNENLQGDPRDTSSPQAMASTWETVLFGDVLNEGSREKLLSWLVDNHTGDQRIRAGLDPTWKVGDKTGTGGHGAANDVAVVWPEPGEPVIVVVFTDRMEASPAERDAVIADAGRAALDAVIRE